jgi:hypothetical protein
MLIAILYLATGLAWTGVSLLEIVAHPHYWEPVTIVDWIAVWTYTLAFVLTALTVPLIARDARAGRAVGVVAAIAGGAAALAAIGNVFEDAFDQSAWSKAYVAGALGTLLAMVGLAALLALRHRPRSALAVALILVGLAVQSAGLGWVALVGGAIAARDRLAAPSGSHSVPGSRHSPGGTLPP